jgi:hypothetical protein
MRRLNGGQVIPSVFEIPQEDEIRSRFFLPQTHFRWGFAYDGRNSFTCSGTGGRRLTAANPAKFNIFIGGMIMKKVSLGLAAVVALLVIVWLPASAQDLSKSYPVSAGASVRVSNVSGDIKVTGTDGNSVGIQAFKEGRDRDKVEIEDLSAGNSIELKVNYPKCMRRGDDDCSTDASVRFEVQVPRSIRFSVNKYNTASGDIQVEGIDSNIHVNTASGDLTVTNSHGDIKANTASGDVLVRNVSGQVSANSASGDVEVQIARLEGNDNLSFNTASGNVNVRMPGELDADVSMTTATGKITTDFPIEVKRHEYGPGSTAKGRIGNGMRQIRLASATGDVSLTKL